MATLYDLAMQYLKQGLPDISGIYPATTTPPPATTDPVDGGDVQPLFPVASQPSGGDGFNPYNIRPGDSSIRTSDQYSPYAYNQAMRNTKKFGQTVGPNPDLYYAPPTGIEQLMSKIPTPFGFVKKGLDAIADKLGPNRTAIFQNELLGQGIKLDNIGRIVTDNYRTPEGIMAGYNPVSGGLLNMITKGAYGEPTTYGLEKSVAERQSNIRDTLQDKYRLSNKQIEDVLAEIEETGTYTGPLGFNETMGKTTNLFEDLYNLAQFDLMQKNALKKSNLIFEQQLKEKRQSDPAFIEQQKIEEAAKTRRDFQQKAGGGGSDYSPPSKPSSSSSKPSSSSSSGGGGGGRDMGASASRSAAATRSKDLGSMRGGVGR